MSEHLQGGGEKFVEQIDTSAESLKNLERLKEAAEHAAENDPLQKHIESLANSVESQAISGKELNIGDTNTEQSNQTFGNTKELKADSYKRTLRKVRTNLNAPERTLSRIVHQKNIEAVSNGLARTAARPSVLLGGSFGALVGSATLLYLSKHNGFTYNYGVMLILFVGGFLVGGLVELLFKLVVRKKT